MNKRRVDPWCWLWWLIFLGLALVALSEASAVFELASKLLTIF